MKKTAFLLITISAALINFSCEENFDPKTNLENKYVLNCLVRADSTTQFATLSKTYDVEGFNPLSNNIDPSIRGAQVYLITNGKTYPMRDTAIARVDTSRYKTLLNVYYSKGIKISNNQDIQILAIPKEGVTLSAKSRIPNGLIFSSSVNYMREVQTDISLSWITSDNDVIYAPRFKIMYMRRSENPARLHSIEIPLYVDSRGVYHYPEISRSTALFYSGKMVDMMMTKLSEGQNKDDFRLIRLELEVQIYDQFIGNYLSSTTGFFDQLSIRLDEPNYTNINGGYGIFGSVVKDYNTIGFAESYLLAFGYSVTP